MNRPFIPHTERHTDFEREFDAWSNAIDSFNQEVTAHKAHCKAAANRVDQAFKDLGE